jgi:hypothetical protein
MTNELHRTCLILEATGIIYDPFKGREQIVYPFFDELLGTIAPEVAGHPERREKLDKLDKQQTVYGFHLFRGLDHVLLDIQPGQTLLTLDIIWHGTFSPSFVVGLVEDYFKTQQMQVQSFPLQANVLVESEAEKLREKSMV